MAASPEQSPGDVVLRVEGLRKHFTTPGGFRRQPVVVRAVDDVSFDLARGETLGVVGESGCGKSTVARTLMRLDEPTAGRALLDGADVFAMGPRELRRARRRMQIVFQDPYASLNPRMTVEEIIAEPWDIHPEVLERRERPERVRALLESVGLRRDHAERYPHQFSGGQLQRIGVARAMALEPEVLICDEPVSALDVSVQAQVVNLLEEIQARLGIAYIFIAHDLAVVRHLSHRIAVMYLGRIVEIGPEAEISEAPRHPYTKALLSAEPRLDLDAESDAAPRQRILLGGEVPSPADPPSGCRFRTRCWKATELCAREAPPLTADPESRSRPPRLVACHFPESDAGS
ncbi:MAG: dipeptide ABC transporter ATP-binding protein [Ectothiorhodospiraceae bacterium]|nr:dipeptide ABC transporter ATP-binding protein [Ectothiorhodospiraceae bacterium]